MAMFTNNSVTGSSNRKRKRDDNEEMPIEQPQKRAKTDKYSKPDKRNEKASNDGTEDRRQASNGSAGGLSVDINENNTLQVLQKDQPSHAADTNLCLNAAVSTVPDEAQDHTQSAGLLFTSSLNAQDELVATVRRPYAQEQTMPRGFSQEGINMCYRNSVLAALLNCQRFMSYVTNWHMNNEDPIENELPGRKKYPFRILHEIHGLGKLYWMEQCRNPETGKIFHDERTKHFFQGCNHKKDRLPNFELRDRKWQSWAERVRNAANPCYLDSAILQQQDVGEFLTWLLDAIDRQLSRDPRYIWRSYENLYAMKQPQENFNYLFKLRLTERGACPQCLYPVWHRWAHTSPVIEHALQLHVPEKLNHNSSGNPSLMDSIQEYMNVERSYKCSRCERQSDNIPVRLRLQALPEVLFITINRTAYSPQLGAIKNADHVYIPENLDLSKWLEHHEYGVGSKATYQLSTIISHCSLDGGCLDTGHYVSIVRGHGNPSDWFVIDDAQVTRVDLRDWDDSRPGEADPARWTPVLMMYEKVEEVLRPGNIPMHVGWVSDISPPTDGLDYVQASSKQVATSNADHEPKQAFVQAGSTVTAHPGELSEAADVSLKSPNQSNVSEDSLFGNPDAGCLTELFPSVEYDEETRCLWPGAGTLSSRFCAPLSDIEFEQAELFVNVRIGEYDFDFPRRILEFFNPYTERELKMKAVLKAVDPQTKEDMYLALMGGEKGSKETWRRHSPDGFCIGEQSSEATFSKTIKPQVLKMKPAELQTDFGSKSNCSKS